MPMPMPMPMRCSVSGSSLSAAIHDHSAWRIMIVFAEVASVVAADFHGVPSAYTARRANPHHTDFINTERPQATTMNKLRESLGLSAARCH
jgi:hypothetical protein